MQNFIEKPLNEVDTLFKSCNHDPERTIQTVLDTFKKQLDGSTKDLLKVPSLNDIPQDQLKFGQLVRFRCMVQDMYDPEYFMPSFRKGDTVITSLFRDPLGEDFGSEIADSQPMDRSTWHCISIPAENDWVINGYHREALKTFSDKGADSEMELQNEGVPKKKRRSEQTEVNETDKLRPNCFPLSTHQKSCIVKVYGDSANTRLNDVMEVVGILSHFPARTTESQVKASDSLSDEYSFKNPPSSLVPRMHAVFYKKIAHQNPLLGYHIEEESAIIRRHILTEASKWRNELLSILRRVFLSDDLTAEYVLLHLLSRVYVRHDVLPLGKFSLNLQNIRSEQVRLLVGLLSRLVTKCHLVGMSLEFLNGTKFIPSKDYDLNRLQSGFLQLSEGTHLICDENALNAGQLNAVGVDNVKALGNMIQNQSIQYNFGFHQMEFYTDIPVLYISQGKGMIRCDFQMKQQPFEPFDRLTEVAASLDALSEELLVNLRRYITVTKMLDHKLSEHMQKTVQEDFVTMRASNSTMTADDLHNLLVVARYVSLSKGEVELSLESWSCAKQLEAERLARCT